jgi:hypothetical protein
MNNNAVATTDEKYKEITDFCRTFNYPSSTTHSYIRKGEIALHQFPGEPRPKINVSEALRVLSKVKRRYTLPTLRIVRHDDGSVPQRKSNLFA